MDNEKSVLDWRHEAASVPDRGLNLTRTATAAELSRLARELDIRSCERLAVTYTLRPVDSGKYALTGGLEADVTQACVVTLEPVTEHLELPLDVEFQARVSRSEPDGDQPILDGADVEPLVNGMIDVGRIVFECVSAGLDPYPRKAGATFDWVDPRSAAGGGEPEGPFAELARLKNKS